MVRFAAPPPLLFLALLAPLLGGCQPEPYWDGTPAARMLETDDRVREVAIAFDPVTGHSAAVDRLALAEAVRRARAAGRVSIDVVSAPAIEPAFDRDLARLLAGLGISPDFIRRQVSSDLAVNQVVARVHAVVVQSPVCAAVGLSAVEQTGPISARPRQVLGCATAANLAAMIVDPRDLVATSQPGALGAERPVGAIDKMVTDWGKSTDSTASSSSSKSSGSASSSSAASK